jgi:hypothetical protein
MTAQLKKWPGPSNLVAVKPRAWRAWKQKQEEGTQIPEYINVVTEKAFQRLGYKKTKWLKANWDSFPTKTKWQEMVTRWAREVATNSFHDWWDLKEQEGETQEVDFAALKPEWEDTIDFLTQARKIAGDLLELYLRARANAVGIRSDGSVRNKQAIRPEKKKCRMCTGHDETLMHVWLSCVGHAENRTPLRTAMQHLVATHDSKFQQCEDDKDIMQAILNGTWTHITRIALKCLQNMLCHLEEYND